MHDKDLRRFAFELADSGNCHDFWDVELEMLARGCSAADARRTTADTAMREGLNQRCTTAKLRPRLRAFLHVSS